MLLKDMPSFCRSTWSSYTVAVKNIDDYMHSEKQVVGKEEEKRRKEEASRICSILTADERKEFSVIDVKADPFLIALGAIFLIAIA
ncbi:MAG: hypothetical protein OSJ74_07760 [Clostridia bacterium]|nr:hypothetical protein [Clostridia bacterium]